ncbi:MAG TPA: hypothetical protein VJR06_05720, partial [Nitrososphaerales archaeon]|nr:hypothetical protein [Nitrososphaerales archaeon]
MGERVEAGATRFLLARPPVWSLVLRRSRRFSGLLKRSGRIGNPVALAGESVARGVFGALLAVPLSIAGGLLV